MRDLEPLEYGVAQAAAEACFRQQATNDRRPHLRRFLEMSRSLSPRRAGASKPQRPDLTTNVFIECLESPARNPRLAGARKAVFVKPLSKQNDPDYVRGCAQAMCRRFEEVYGRRWIVVRTRPATDDGLRGEPARHRAYEAILAGPDTPGKRWLLAR